MDRDSEYSYESDDVHEPGPLFEIILHCLPFSKYKNPQLETGDKIIMPQSSLDQIVSRGIQYPLFFKTEGLNDRNKVSHCGVLEFDADEGFVHMPEWMMNNLDLQEGDLVVLRDAALPKGSYMKLRPHAAAFTAMSDPVAVLEKKLREFACLSKGDTFMLKHNGRDFYFDVLEATPGGAVSLIDTDCRVDFAPALDYKEEERVVKKKEIRKVDDQKALEGEKFRPFTGAARRLDGEAGSGECAAPMVAEPEKRKKDGGRREEGKEKFKAFTGRAHVLGTI